MLTKNFERLQSEVAAHVAADRVAQGSYSTCFIGCLANGKNDPEFVETEYGIPLMVTRIAESIFEGLRSNEAPDFFAALPEAIGSDGKDLTRVAWQFLAAELRALPPVPDDIYPIIDPVIEGMDLLAEGKEWPEASTAAVATWSAANAAANAAARAHTTAARAHTTAAYAAYAAADAARAHTTAAYAAYAAADAAYAAATAHISATAADAAARLRQRDTLLRLIKEAPTTQEEI